MKKICPQCEAEIKENAKFCGKCGTRYEESKNGNTSTRQEVQQKQIIVPRKRKLKVLAIVLVIAIAILLIFVPGSGKNWEDVVKEYFSVSQNKFSEQGIENEVRQENFTEQDNVGEISGDRYTVKLNKPLWDCGYTYMGVMSESCDIHFYVDENENIQAISCNMNLQYDNDFITIILDSMLSVFADLNEKELYNVKSQFSMSDRLGLVVFEDGYGSYEYDGKVYVVDSYNGFTTFDVYNSDVIESINDNAQ